MLLTRIAPTPSGYLHAGNGFSFLLTQWLAARLGAGLLLRIDDLDSGRNRPEYVADVFDTLSWLGIQQSHGPANPDDFALNWSQTGRVALYNNYLQELSAAGFTYVCTCSRSMPANQCRCSTTMLPADTPESCVKLKLRPDTRIMVGAQLLDLHKEMGDFVLQNRHGKPAYQLASLADDVHFGVTHVVRGMDLLMSTAAQLYLAKLLGLEAFGKVSFYHHPLLTAENGLKLSKSAGASSLKAMREEGKSPEFLHQLVRQFTATAAWW